MVDASSHLICPSHFQWLTKSLKRDHNEAAQLGQEIVQYAIYRAANTYLYTTYV